MKRLPWMTFCPAVLTVQLERPINGQPVFFTRLSYYTDCAVWYKSVCNHSCSKCQGSPAKQSERYVAQRCKHSFRPCIGDFDFRYCTNNVQLASTPCAPDEPQQYYNTGIANNHSTGSFQDQAGKTPPYTLLATECIAVRTDCRVAGLQETSHHLASSSFLLRFQILGRHHQGTRMTSPGNLLRGRRPCTVHTRHPRQTWGTPYIERFHVGLDVFQSCYSRQPWLPAASFRSHVLLSEQRSRAGRESRSLF